METVDSFSSSAEANIFLTCFEMAGLLTSKSWATCC